MSTKRHAEMGISMKLFTSKVIKRHLPWLCLLPLLSACVTEGGPAPRPESTPLARQVIQQLNQFNTLLPGRYGNFLQYHSEQQGITEAEAHRKTPPLFLDIDIQSDLTEQLNFVVEQRNRGSQVPSRAFIWTIIATETQLVLRVTPRDRVGARPCDIPLKAISGGYAGQSDPRLCAIGNANGPQLGIRKEIAITRGQITLADQLIELNSGEIRIDTRLEFQRIAHFKGWAGVRNEHGEWQLSKEFALHNDGDQVSLMGRDGFPLGVKLQLARVLYRENKPPMLRLSVFKEPKKVAGKLVDENARDELVGYSWAAISSGQIGINIDWLQAGLEFIEP
ncbi:MAG: hypothetical protein MI750_10730 [Xanthomonadales bacterium]|nr:hypothetical protein [Xanthomonadales bacterium]